MRKTNFTYFTGSDHSNQTGAAIDTNQTVSMSFQAFFGDTNAGGTFKLQASNDPKPGYTPGANPPVPTNWTDIPNQSATITSGASALLTIAQCAYAWVRATYTSTATGIQTIATRADVSGNLAGKYFLLNSANAGVGYYVWFKVSGTGADPTIAGRTGVEVDISTNNTASQVGTALASAIEALTEFTASGTTTVTVTNSASGPFTAMTDGTSPLNTAFTFAVTAGGTSTITCDVFGLSI